MDLELPMSKVGSALNNTRSALSPDLILPRSYSLKVDAATEVAPARASAGVKPAATRRASSSWIEIPNGGFAGTYGDLLLSVPTTTGMPAA